MNWQTYWEEVPCFPPLGMLSHEATKQLLMLQNSEEFHNVSPHERKLIHCDLEQIWRSAHCCLWEK